MKSSQNPYYAVIFTSQMSDQTEGYAEAARHMEGLARQQEGFLGFESAREGIGISVSYWKDLKSIEAWKKNIHHRATQKAGREKYYRNYTVRVCRVEKEYSFRRED